MLELFGGLWQGLFALVLCLCRKAPGTSRTGLVIQADQPRILPPSNPGGHRVSCHPLDGGTAADRKALLAPQDPMGSHASPSGGMKALHVGQGVDFRVAERRHKFHRLLISLRRLRCQGACKGLEDSVRTSPL